MATPTLNRRSDVVATRHETPGHAVDRRGFLKRGVEAAGAVAVGGVASTAALGAGGEEAAPPGVPPWMLPPGAPLRGYGQPSRFEEPVKRIIRQPYGQLAPGTGASLTLLSRMHRKQLAQHAPNGTAGELRRDPRLHVAQRVERRTARDAAR